MNIAVVLALLFIHLGFLIAFNCLWLFTRALCPGLVERTRELYAQPVKSFGVGLLTGLLPGALGLVLVNAGLPALKLLGWLLFLSAVLTGFIGSAGLADRVGRGLAIPSDEGQPWRQTYRGGVVLSFIFILPFIGWFLVLPVVLITGNGSFVRARRVRAKAEVSPSPESLQTEVGA